MLSELISSTIAGVILGFMGHGEYDIDNNVFVMIGVVNVILSILISVISGGRMPMFETMGSLAYMQMIIQLIRSLRSEKSC